MTDDQKGLIVGMLHTTIDYLHALEVIFIQLMGTVGFSMANPPAKISAQESVDMEKALEVLKNTVYKDHQFPWGVCEKKDEKGPGVTRIIAETPNGVVAETPCAERTFIRDHMVYGPKGKPERGLTDAHD